MNKTASCIKLIEILYSLDDFINTKSLANLLDTNPRNIREYFKELDSLGYEIESSKGLYGGYRLKKECFLPAMNLDEYEEGLIYNAIDKLKEIEFPDISNLEAVLGKILLNQKKEIVPLRMIDRYPPNIEFDKLKDAYIKLQNGIEGQFKLKITYLTFNDKEVIHIVHPIDIFLYNGSYFLLSLDEIKEEYAFYKLDRIVDIENLKIRYSLSPSFKLIDYLDEFGIKKNDPYFDIEVELTNLNKVIKNHIYGKNQEVKIISSNKALLSVSMQNKSSIIAFILSFGASAKVLSPKWLIDAVKENLNNTLKNYEG